MTDNQRKTLMIEWWPNACRVQGWKASDRVLRLQVFSLAITFVFTDVMEFRDALKNYDQLRAMPPSEHRPRFRHLESASDLNATTDIDAVKALLLMMADNLKGADEHGKPERGHGRRFHNVLADYMKCLSQYPLEKPMGLEGAEAFVQEIINDKFNRGQRIQKMTLEDVDDRPRFVHNDTTGRLDEKASPLEQLVMTVSARLNGKTGFRSKALHSLHDMLTGVGLICNCRQCVNARSKEYFDDINPAPIIPPLSAASADTRELATDPHLTDGDPETPF